MRRGAGCQPATFTVRRAASPPGSLLVLVLLFLGRVSEVLLRLVGEVVQGAVFLPVVAQPVQRVVDVQRVRLQTDQGVDRRHRLVGAVVLLDRRGVLGRYRV